MSVDHRGTEGAASRAAAANLEAVRKGWEEAIPELDGSPLPVQSRVGMTRTLDRLESQGLVERTAHPRDRRRVSVELTAHGADVAESVYRTELGLMTGALTGLSDRDRRRLVGLIDRMIDNFDTYAPASASDSSDSE